MATYELIDSTVLGSASASVSFTSIPATYRDLVLVMDATASSAMTPLLRFNSDSGTNYSFVRANGDGSTADSASATGFTYIGGPSFSPIDTGKSVHIFQIMDYSATDKHKTVLGRWNLSSAGVSMTASRWASTSAINAVSATASSGDFAAGSTFYLYGISA